MSQEPTDQTDALTVQMEAARTAAEAVERAKTEVQQERENTVAASQQAVEASLTAEQASRQAQQASQQAQESADEVKKLVEPLLISGELDPSTGKFFWWQQAPAWGLGLGLVAISLFAIQKGYESSGLWAAVAVGFVMAVALSYRSKFKFGSPSRDRDGGVREARDEAAGTGGTTGTSSAGG